MDKRAIIGIALSILVLIGYQTLVTWYYGSPPSSPAPMAEKVGEEKAGGAAPMAPPRPLLFCRARPLQVKFPPAARLRTSR